jgi:hypothetical protein
VGNFTAMNSATPNHNPSPERGNTARARLLIRWYTSIGVLVPRTYVKLNLDTHLTSE